MSDEVLPYRYHFNDCMTIFSMLTCNYIPFAAMRRRTKSSCPVNMSRIEVSRKKWREGGQILSIKLVITGVGEMLAPVGRKERSYIYIYICGWIRVIHKCVHA